MTTRMLRRTAATALLVALAASLLAGCSPQSSPTPSGPAKLQLVASTSVWGSIAQQVAGSNANVHVILGNPAQDPHSYEATLRDRLAVQNADLVVYNGMGYDDFMTKLNTFSAGQIAPLEACKSVGVEHCFYQIGVAHTVASQLAKDLSTLDPTHAADYLNNAATVADQDTALIALSQAIVTGRDNIAVVETEPVMGSLLSEMGFDNVTPLDFTKAIEGGRDVPVSTLKLVQDRIVAAQLSFLAVNRQTSTAQVAALVKLCADNGVSVVYFDELMPAGQNYYSWMRAKILEIRKLTGVDEIGANNG
jgi:zinc/manganese transport system substrate-binding protein